MSLGLEPDLVEPTHEELAAIASAIYVVFSAMSSAVDKAEDRNDLWVTRHRKMARISH